MNSDWKVLDLSFHPRVWVTKLNTLSESTTVTVFQWWILRSFKEFHMYSFSDKTCKEQMFTNVYLWAKILCAKQRCDPSTWILWSFCDPNILWPQLQHNDFWVPILILLHFQSLGVIVPKLPVRVGRSWCGWRKYGYQFHLLVQSGINVKPVRIKRTQSIQKR